MTIENRAAHLMSNFSQFSLIILSRCAFGIPRKWLADEYASKEVALREYLDLVTNSYMVRAVTPRWMYSLPIPQLHKIENAFVNLNKALHDLVHERRKVIFKDDQASSSRDVLSLMVRAREREEKMTFLSDEELAEDMSFLLIAGHETTASALNTTLGLLALYQDIQEEMFKSVEAIAAGDMDIIFSMDSELDKLQACFIEAARLFPPSFALARETAGRVNPVLHDGSSTISIGSGVPVAVDLIGIHYNSRYFSDPEDYRPSRWYGASESELSMFSIGPRACLGRRFALTEACCFLAHVLRDWRVDIITKPGESRAQWRERVMRAETSLTMGTLDSPLRFIRR